MNSITRNTFSLLSALVINIHIGQGPIVEASVITTALSKKESLVYIKAFDVKFKNNSVKRSYNAGAGAILDDKGHIITNLHILTFKSYIQVTLHNGATHPAKLIDVLSSADLALLKIDTDKELKPVALSNSDHVKLNDRVIHIGSSHFIQDTISEGKITGIGHSHQQTNTADIFQVNLNLYHGDSGGPLLNVEGQLIGIISAQLKNQNRKAFAIPSNKIQNIYRKNIK